MNESYALYTKYILTLCYILNVSILFCFWQPRVRWNGGAENSSDNKRRVADILLMDVEFSSLIMSLLLCIHTAVYRPEGRLCSLSHYHMPL